MKQHIQMFVFLAAVSFLLWMAVGAPMFALMLAVVPR